MVSLLGFRTLIESLGHEYGDQLLKVTARHLLDQTEAAELLSPSGARLDLYHFEGSRFGILIQNVSEPEFTADLVRRLSQSFKAPMIVHGTEVFLTLRAGSSRFPADDHDPMNLINHADRALLQMKADDTCHYCAFEAGMVEAAQERLSLENDLRHALEKDQLHVVYQPQYDATGTQILGAEALVRWSHPGRGNIPPGDFIPVAERTGLIVPIGLWVLERACNDIQSWHEQGLSPMRVAVNLSIRQLQTSDLVDSVLGILAKTGVDTDSIELEITESMAMEDLHGTLAALDRLNAHGIRITIDDFGTGHSSLAYLSTLPIDKLKIDRAFVSGIDQHERNKALVRAMIDIGHSLELALVAEGVETTRERELLAAMGCEIIQGYLTGKPMDAAALAARLAARNTPPSQHCLGTG